MKLADYSLVRIYQLGVDPYAVVTDLPPDRAVDVCRTAEPTRGLDNPNDQGHRDQNAYMQRRRDIESWLRDQAQTAGVKIDKQNPVYFALTKYPNPFRETFLEGKIHPSLEQSAKARPNATAVILPAAELDLSNWSFTMNDHFFANFSNGSQGLPKISSTPPHDLHGRVLNAEQLASYLKTSGRNDAPHHYFEAQMWAPAPVRLAINPEPPSIKSGPKTAF